MSVFTLKILALTAMIIDHMGFFLRANSLIAYDPYNLMRAIGRIAFPIYCFLLVNGFDKTSNRRRPPPWRRREWPPPPRQEVG